MERKMNGIKRKIHKRKQEKRNQKMYSMKRWRKGENEEEE